MAGEGWTCASKIRGPGEAADTGRNCAPGHRQCRQRSTKGSGHRCACPEEELSEHPRGGIAWPKRATPQADFCVYSFIVNTVKHIHKHRE